jgi:hypothetical protein
MKKSLLVLPAIMLLLAACAPADNPSNSTGGSSTSEQTSTSEPTSTLPPTTTSVAPLELSTIAEVRALSAEGEAMIEGSVVAKNTQGFVVADETGMMLVYLKALPSVNVGDFVRVSGLTSTYQGFRQITTPTIAAGEGTNPNISLSSPAQWTGAEWDAFNAETGVPTYITGVATMFASGTYTNFHYHGIGETADATLPGSVAYADDSLNFAVPANVGRSATFEAILIGTSISGGAPARQNILVTSFSLDEGGSTGGGETTTDPEPPTTTLPGGSEEVEGAISITSAKLGLSASYTDVASVDVDGLAIGATSIADYGDGIQMRYKDPVQSAFYNIEATSAPIVSIKVVYNLAKSTDFAPTILDVYGATSALKDVHTGGQRLATVLGTGEYLVEFDAAAGINFFKIEKPALSYTAYLTEVVVTLAV